MIRDSIVDDIHRVRDEIAARHHGDLKLISEGARIRQAESGRRVAAYRRGPLSPAHRLRKPTRPFDRWWKKNRVPFNSPLSPMHL